MSEERYISIVNQLLKEEKFYILDTIFSEYTELSSDVAKDLIKFSLKTDLVKKEYIKDAHNFVNYFLQLDRCFEYFSEEEKKIAINLVKRIKSWNISIIEPVIGIVLKYVEWKNLRDDKKIDLIKDTLAFVISSSFLDISINEKDIQALWFIDKIENDRVTYLRGIEVFTFEFSKQTLLDLYNAINNQQEKWLYLNYEDMKDISAINLIFQVVLNNQLVEKESREFPKKLLELKIIQRIFVNLILKNEKKISVSATVLISFIDFEFRYYGKEMNHFIESYSDLVNKPDKIGYYTDGIGRMIFGSVESLPFIEINELDYEEKVYQLLDVLKSSNDRREKNEFFVEKTIYAQNQEIIRKINNLPNWDKNHFNNILFITSMIKEERIIIDYEQSITQMLLFGLKNGYIENDLIKMYISQKLSKDNATFSFQDSMFFEQLLDFIKNHEEADTTILNFLISKKLTSILNYSDEFLYGDLQLVKLDSFINTDFGRFWWFIKKIPSGFIVNDNHQLLKDRIENTKPPLNDYLKGMFYQYFPMDRDTNVSSTRFVGYSHFYLVGLSDPNPEFLREAALKLFGNIEDQHIIHNLSFILLYTSNSHDIDSNNSISPVFYEKLMINFLAIYSNYDIIFLNFNDWIIWLLRTKKEHVTFVNFIINNLHKMKNDKLKSLLILFDRLEADNLEKLNDYDLYHIREIENISDMKMNLLVDLLKSVFRLHLIRTNTPFLESISKILSISKINGYNDAIIKLSELLKNELLPEDYKKYVSIYTEE